MLPRRTGTLQRPAPRTRSPKRKDSDDDEDYDRDRDDDDDDDDDEDGTDARAYSPTIRGGNASEIMDDSEPSSEESFHEDD